MHLRRFWFLLAALLIGPAIHAQSVIELRPTAYVVEGGAVTLNQIARLEGPDAIALAGVEISNAAGKTVSIEEVRRALAASGRINWGRITLRGATCSFLGPAPEPKPEEPAPAVEPAPPASNTVRAAVATHLARMLKVVPEDLQLAFAPEDADYLNTPTINRSVQVHPSAMAEKMPLRIAVYEGDRIIGGEHALRVGVRVRREAAVALVAKRRGETIAAEDYSVETRWVSPTIRPASADQLSGAAARERVSPGDIIEAADAAPAVVVGKGDIVAIRCISGGVILATRARALSPGRDGDLVEFQAMDGKRRFFARMDGRGRAIVCADSADSTEPLPRSASLPVRGDRIPPPFPPEASR